MYFSVSSLVVLRYSGKHIIFLKYFAKSIQSASIKFQIPLKPTSYIPLNKEELTSNYLIVNMLSFFNMGPLEVPIT